VQRNGFLPFAGQFFVPQGRKIDLQKRQVSVAVCPECIEGQAMLAFEIYFNELLVEPPNSNTYGTK
jgi:hypothetical protein